jgi:DNA-binding transcriptional LysR family regulator
MATRGITAHGAGPRRARINPRQLEAFRMVMAGGSVATAARLMYVTQPAVSRLVHELEACLRLRLFERHGVTLRPTEDALSLFQEVERSYIGLERIAAFAQALHERRTESLRVVATSGLATTFLPCFLSRFAPEWPETRLNVGSLPQHQVAQAIAADQYDVGIVGMPVDHPAVTAGATEAVEAMAVLPADHPSAGKRFLEPADLGGENFISLGPSSMLRHRVDAWFAEAGVEREVRMETSLATIACVLVAGGSGVTIVEPFAVVEFLSRGLALKPLNPPIPHEMQFLWSAKRPLPRVAAAFVDAFRAELRALPRTWAPA